VTYALATQLVVTLPGPLGDAGMAELAAIWEELRQFGEQIEDVPLAELRDRLTEFEARILQVVRAHAEDPTEDSTEDSTDAEEGDPADGTTSGGGAATATDGGEEPAEGTAGPGGSAAPTGSSSSGAGSAPASGSTAESTAGSDAATPTSGATSSG